MTMQRRRRRIAAGLVLALATTLVGVSSTMATFPGRNGDITFMKQDAHGFFQTWVAKPTSAHARQLTSVPSEQRLVRMVA